MASFASHLFYVLHLSFALPLRLLSNCFLLRNNSNRYGPWMERESVGHPFKLDPFAFFHPQHEISRLNNGFVYCSFLCRFLFRSLSRAHFTPAFVLIWEQPYCERMETKKSLLLYAPHIFLYFFSLTFSVPCSLSDIICFGFHVLSFTQKPFETYLFLSLFFFVAVQKTPRIF